MAEETNVQEALTQAYEKALELEKAGEHEAAAKHYLEALRLDPADHCGASVRLAAIAQAQAPQSAPAAYIRTLFDQHAEVFDLMLVEQLGYDVPLQIRELLLKSRGDQLGDVLDLGCGTGLVAEALEGMCDYIMGVDLSEGMLEIAAEKEVYDALFLGDGAAFLEDADIPDEMIEDKEAGADKWNVITAADMLPYLGALEPLFAGAARRLEAGGAFVFSTETAADELLAGQDYMVGPTHRFFHAEAYLRRALDEAGFEVESLAPIVVRREEEGAATGHLVLARKRA